MGLRLNTFSYGLYLRDCYGEVVPTVAFYKIMVSQVPLNYIAKSLKESLNRTINPTGGGTFITHHMVFDCETVDRFLVQLSTSSGLALVSCHHDNFKHGSPLGEYPCYASFAIKLKALNFHV